MKYFFLILAFWLAARVAFSVDFMDVSGIKPGMKGYGLSVFKGWEPEKFGVEIIDIVKNSSPKGDVILAKLSGPDVEKSGVVAGMSGSPVYIEDKLVGAVAYTWTFAKEPLCGITPIGQMVREKENAYSDNGYNGARFDSGFLKNIDTPIFLKGYSGEGEEFVKKMLSGGGGKNEGFNGNFLVMNSGGGGNGSADAGESNLEAGDSVAVNLVDGDFHAEGIGTVTYVSNNDVFIFGHPMDLAGNISLPISKSYIYTVIPSSYFSFKLGSSSVPIGAVVFDGQYGVYCRLGHIYSMVPVDVAVEKEGNTHIYHFRVAESRPYLPALTSGAIASSFLNHAGYLDDKRIRLSYTIEAEYADKLYKAENVLYYAFNPGYFSVYGMITDLNALFAAFYENSLGGIKIRRIGVKIEITRGLDYYIVDNMTVDRSSYYPGDTVRCKVLLKELGSSYAEKYLEFRIPLDMRPGQYAVLAGSETAFYNESAHLFPKYYAVNSIDDLIRLASQRLDLTRLTAGLIYPRQGMTVRNKKLEKFPDNYQFIFDYNKPWDKVNIMMFPEWIKTDIPLDKAVYGIMKINISVSDKQSQGPE